MLKRGIALALMLGLAGPMAAARTGNGLTFDDFEREGYGKWKATGEAFGNGPVSATLPQQQAVSGYHGKRWVSSYAGSDGTQGTLRSPEFVVRKPYVRFLVGGGGHAGRTCINLVVKGKVARTATGADDERLVEYAWNVKDLIGKKARIEIVDRATERWGHINVDDIRMSDIPSGEGPGELYHEKYRPQFHFTAQQNWINDPNGLVYYKGQYHLFFQHNPYGREWGHMTWGHAVSPDLVHWEQFPHALFPDPQGTMFSGSAVVDHGNTAGFRSGDEETLALVYTAAGGTSPESEGQPFTQGLAYSTDGGKTFAKYRENPVLGHVAAENRDPKIEWHAPTRRWIMILYLEGSDYALYASPDLKRWEHLQTFSIPGTGECPDFFELPVEGEPGESRWVATAANGHYLVGRFDGKQFTSEEGPFASDLGANFYAVQTYSDTPDGRRIQISWMNGGKYPDMPFNGQMSFPCTLTLHRTPEGLRLRRNPVKEIESLRGKPREWSDLTLKPGDDPLAGVEGDTFEIEAEFEAGDATEIAFNLRGEEVRYSVAEKTLTFAGRSGGLEPEGGRVRLRILVDRTSLEAFGNGGQLSMTSCVLLSPENRGLSLTAKGGAARIRSLKVYPLKSAWPG